MSKAADLTFVCPSCGESLTVNNSMRDALLDNGCVICGAGVSNAAFSSESKSDPDSGTTSESESDSPHGAQQRSGSETGPDPGLDSEAERDSRS